MRRPCSATTSGKTQRFLAKVMLLSVTPVGLAGAQCVVPDSYATIGEALADETCLTIALGAGVFDASEMISRTVAITGAGSGATSVVGAPAFIVGNGGGLGLADLTLLAPAAIERAVVSLPGGLLQMSNVAITVGGPAGSQPIFADGFETP